MTRRFVVIAVLLFWATGVLAQTGGLRVQVLDATDNEPLAGATVLLSNVQQLIAPSASISDARGEVEFPVLRAGTGYVIEVSLAGFSTYRLSDLRVRSNETRTIALELAGELKESIRVLANSDAVNLDRSARGNRFSEDFVVELPVPGRFYQNVLVLAAGVNDADGDGNPNVHGSRSRDFNARVSGISNVDPLTGRWLDFVNPESIEEIEVLTAGAGAEFGRAQGGFANIVQKQGNNDMEGVLGYIYRDSRFDGTGATALRGEISPDFDWRQPSIQLSGPLIKDRMWYRLSHEWIDRDDPRSFASAIGLERIEQATHADQITWQASPRNKLAFQYQYGPLEIENFGISDTIPEESTRTVEAGGPTYSIRITSPYSPRVLIEGMVGYQDYRREATPTTFGVWQDCIRFSRFDLGRTLNPTRCFNSDTGLTSGSHPETSDDRRERLTVAGSATVVTPELWGASHKLKFGFNIENERYFRELERGPDVRFNIEKTLLDPCPLGGKRPCFQDIGFAAVDVSVPREANSTATGNSWGVYVEDQVRLRDDLTLTAGFRVDRDELQSRGGGPFDPQAEGDLYLEQFETRCAASGFPTGPCVRALTTELLTAFSDIAIFEDQLREALRLSSTQISLGTTASQSAFWTKKRETADLYITNTNFSPRLSMAWDPGSDGRTKVSLTAGRYHDRMFLAIPLLELEPPRTTLLFSGSNLMSPFYSTFAPDEGINPAVSVTMVDQEDLQTPYQDELTLGFERELWPETVFKATYIRRKFRDQLQDSDVNHRTADLGRCRRALQLGEPTVEASNGAGFVIVDVYSGESYEDTDPGPGDGRLDDCSGDVQIELIDVFFPPTTRSLPRPDGLPDLYVANPGWGEILLVDNINTTDYEALVLELVRRLYRSWELQASYIWSESVGDAEDFVQALGNESNLANDERGFLSYDQTHVVRVNATTITPWGFRAGAALRWESGLPYSVLATDLTLFSVPPQFLNLGDVAADFRLRYPSRQRNDERNPSFWNLDLRVAREWALGSQVLLQTTVEVFNVLNDDTPRAFRQLDGRISGERRFGRRWQLGVRLSF